MDTDGSTLTAPFDVSEMSNRSAEMNSVGNKHTTHQNKLLLFQARSFEIQNNMCRFSYCRKLLNTPQRGRIVPSSYSTSEALLEWIRFRGRNTT